MKNNPMHSITPFVRPFDWRDRVGNQVLISCLTFTDGSLPYGDEIILAKIGRSPAI